MGCVVVVALGVWAVHASVRAQVTGDCASLEPGPCWVLPRPGTQEAVTLDAPIQARFTPGYFEQFDPASATVEVYESGTDTPVAGDLLADGDSLFFIPDGGWEPLTAYEGVVLGQARDIGFGFSTGERADRAPPSMGAILEVEPAQGSTVPELGEGSMRVDVTFEAATDDGPLGSLEYLLYVTRSRDIEAPELRLRRLHQPGVITAALGLRARETAEPVCIAIVAVDGVGKTDTTGERCFEPTQGDFFEPLCSAAPGPRRPAGAAGPAWLLAGLLALVIRRRGRLSARRERRVG